MTGSDGSEVSGTPGAARRLLMCSALDSVRQASLVPDDVPPSRWSGRSVGSDGIAAVRAPLLLADRLAVTPNQLFDGRVLLALGPDGFAEVAGHAQRSHLEPLPLRIAVPDRIGDASAPPRARLEASLASLLRFPGSPPGAPLRAFRWSLLPRTAGTLPAQLEVATALGRLSSQPFEQLRQRAGAAEAVATMLGAAGVPASVTDALQRRWTTWLDAADRIEVITITLDGIRADDVTPRLIHRSAAVTARSIRRTDPLLAVLRAGLQEDRPDHELPEGILALRTRTQAYRWIEERAERIPPDVQQGLRRWVDLVYLRSQARQAGAWVLDLEVVDTDASPDTSLELVDDDAVPLRIERRFLDDIRRMPPELFATVRFRLRTAVTAIGGPVSGSHGPHGPHGPPGPTSGTYAARGASRGTARRNVPGAAQRRAERGAARTIATILSEELQQPAPARRYAVTALKVVVTVLASTLLLVDVPLVITLALLLVVIALLPELELLVTLRPGRMQRRFDLRRRR